MTHNLPELFQSVRMSKLTSSTPFYEFFARTKQQTFVIEQAWTGARTGERYADGDDAAGAGSRRSGGTFVVCFQESAPPRRFTRCFGSCAVTNSIIHNKDSLVDTSFIDMRLYQEGSQRRRLYESSPCASTTTKGAGNDQ